jgi:hypothetical protein
VGSVILTNPAPAAEPANIRHLRSGIGFEHQVSITVFRGTAPLIAAESHSSLELLRRGTHTNERGIRTPAQRLASPLSLFGADELQADSYCCL